MSQYVRIVFGFAWIVIAFAAPAQAQRTGTVQQNAPIFLTPGAQQPLRVAATGTVLEILGTESAWLKVQFNDPQFGRRTGYVEAKFVREVPTAAALTPMDLSVKPASPQTAPPPTSERPNVATTGERPATVVPTPSTRTAPVDRRATAGQTLTFRKVDYAEMQGDKERSRAARLVLDPVTQTVTFADEGDGEAKTVYARVPYGSITKIVYEQSSHRRYGAGVMVSPLLFFTKGKKHWLTLEFQNVSALPQGFVYARLDKDNYRQVLSALRAGTGLTVEEHIEN
jgi:hypothetical protein